MTQNISIALLDYNKGQLKGLPKNPRFFRDYRFEAMKKSIEESPEMLELRELIVFPYDNGRYVVVCGNLRLRACKELGYAELPCKVLDAKTKPKKLREYNPNCRRVGCRKTTSSFCGIGSTLPCRRLMPLLPSIGVTQRVDVEPFIFPP